MNQVYHLQYNKEAETQQLRNINLILNQFTPTDRYLPINKQSGSDHMCTAKHSTPKEYTDD